MGIQFQSKYSDRFSVHGAVSIGSSALRIYRGYYTAVRRYEFYLRVVKTPFYERAQRVSTILFLPQQVSNINFRSIMVKTWLYFN